MISLAVVLAAQASVWSVSPSAPTVGDTVRLTRLITAGLGVESQVDQLKIPPTVRLLAEPTVGYSEGSVVVSYILAFFEPGSLTIAMPDVELVTQEGTVEYVLGDTARVFVRSVLPAGDSLHDPKPSLGPLVQPSKRPQALAFSVLMTLGAIATWLILRRRSSGRPTTGRAVAETAEAPLLEWARAGESRAVVAAAADRLRYRIADLLPDAGRELTTEECVGIAESLRPDWPIREISETLSALDRARFAAAISGEVLELANRAQLVGDSLTNNSAENV